VVTDEPPCKPCGNTRSSRRIINGIASQGRLRREDSLSCEAALERLFLSRLRSGSALRHHAGMSVQIAGLRSSG